MEYDNKINVVFVLLLSFFIFGCTDSGLVGFAIGDTEGNLDDDVMDREKSVEKEIKEEKQEAPVKEKIKEEKLDPEGAKKSRRR